MTEFLSISRLGFFFSCFLSAVAGFLLAWTYTDIRQGLAEQEEEERKKQEALTNEGEWWTPIGSFQDPHSGEEKAGGYY